MAGKAQFDGVAEAGGPGQLVRLVAAQEIELAKILLEAVANHMPEEHASDRAITPSGIVSRLIKRETSSVLEAVKDRPGGSVCFEYEHARPAELGKRASGAPMKFFDP